jgi:membrane-bound lytic murein transglycosylase D
MIKWPFNIKKYLVAFFSLACAVTSILFFAFSKNDDDRAYQDYFNSNYKIFSLNIPKDLNFCDEKVPQSDFMIKEALDREFTVNTYWQSNSLFYIKRANRWFRIIEPVLKKYGVPNDVKYICAIESNFTNAISPSNAVGFWQLLENTAKGYGLEITDEVDERYHVEKSTEAACKYFLEAHKKFNNWTLAAASYNMGMGGLESQMGKQKVNNYYDLLLNDETSRYVYRVLALKTLMQTPKKYGFLLRKKDLYPYVPTIRLAVDTTISDLAVFAISQGYNYKILKIFNPWLRKNTLTNTTSRKYIIEFPKKEYLANNLEEFSEELLPENDKKDSLYNAKADTVPVSNEKLIIPVSKNTSIEEIITKYATTKQMLYVWNSVNSDAELLKLKEMILYTGKVNAINKPSVVDSTEQSLNKKTTKSK